MIRALALLAGLVLPQLAWAKDPLLVMPLDCTLGKDCYVHDYVDRDAGDGVRDFTCGGLTRDAHSGTDFALLTHKARNNGVNVLAASPGRVIWVRDGMPDIASTAPNAPDITGRACGNGVAIRHGGGWITRYCHLKQDSVTVQKGQRVRMRSVLGQVGMSGLSNYPHVHFTVRKGDQLIDPFDTSPIDRCGAANRNSLWMDSIPYKSAGWIRAGFATEQPETTAIDDGLESQKSIAANEPRIGAWGHFYGVQPGDNLTITWVQPSGASVVSSRVSPGTNKRNFRWYSRVSEDAPWPKGTYTVTFELIRNGEVLDVIQAKTRVE